MIKAHEINLSSIALFLDVDGSLADIAECPSLAHIPQLTKDALHVLHGKLDGALAIISGRRLMDIDAMLAPHVFACAACHGGIIRTAAGIEHHANMSDNLVSCLSRRAKRALAGCSGVLVEEKEASLAIHYRMSPEHGALCRTVARQLVSPFPLLTTISGKMVVEIVCVTVGKGWAITRLMQDPAFAKRRPVFIGDDLTDESGFGVVNLCSGLSVKVGLGPTQATHRFHSPDDVRTFVCSLAGRRPDPLGYKQSTG